MIKPAKTMRPPRKLKVERETVRALAANALSGVAGGVTNVNCTAYSWDHESWCDCQPF